MPVTPRGTPLTDGLSNRVGKLGKRIWAFSLPRVATCPGMSEWCREFCYMEKLEKLYASMVAAYHANLENATLHPLWLGDALIRRIERLRDPAAVRIHVDGDFFSAPYVRMWIRVIREHPSVRFYAYTRSWRVKRLRKSLEELRALPNMTLFASVDPTVEDPPAEWRKAWIAGDPRATGPVCPEQRGKKADCGACGLCFKTKIRNITFRVH